MEKEKNEIGIRGNREKGREEGKKSEDWIRKVIDR